GVSLISSSDSTSLVTVLTVFMQYPTHFFHPIIQSPFLIGLLTFCLHGFEIIVTNLNGILVPNLNNRTIRIVDKDHIAYTVYVEKITIARYATIHIGEIAPNPTGHILRCELSYQNLLEVF